MTVYPSIAATSLGRAIGMLCDSIPLGRSPVRLSHLLFGPIVAPIAALVYLWQKAFGTRYVLTSRAVREWASVGVRLYGEALLAEIDEITVVEHKGQAFYHAADLTIYDSRGEELLVLEGIPRAEVFRETILEARDARRQVEASLATIDARHRQPA